MSLSQKQQDFMRCVGQLLTKAYKMQGVGVTAGDFWARRGHHPRSTHYKRLACDLNLFVDGEYIESYDQAELVWDTLGEFWEGLDERARWGGRFGDMGHFSFEHEGVK